MGIFAHEFGHTLGLRDLYVEGNYWDGLGYHSLMASGDSGHTGKKESSRPLEYVGTSPVETITEEQALTMIDSGLDGGKVYKLPVQDPLTNKIAPSRYYLIENRQMRGFDKGRKH